MRIDLNPAVTSGLDRTGNSATASRQVRDTTASSDGVAMDVAQLSTGSDAVQNLKIHLQSVPEIRQSRVDSLRQAISNGSYQVSPTNVAAAMLGDAIG